MKTYHFSMSSIYFEIAYIQHKSELYSESKNIVNFLYPQFYDN